MTGKIKQLSIHGVISKKVIYANLKDRSDRTTQQFSDRCSYWQRSQVGSDECLHWKQFSLCVCEHSLFLTNMSTGVCLKTVLNWTKCRSARLTNFLRVVLKNRTAWANKWGLRSAYEPKLQCHKLSTPNHWFSVTFNTILPNLVKQWTTFAQLRRAFTQTPEDHRFLCPDSVDANGECTGRRP